jgi:crotonobetainyl-CoA:carnitine CoA-transferase CaiB-like acyl-CoA transferase
LEFELEQEKSMEQALSDIKVLDLTHYIAGPYCTKLLADYGADVLKVEKPGGGDPARKMGPFLGDDPHPDKSGLFLHLNTSKRGITLNLKTQTGKKIFRQLVKDVDILVESFSPRVMPSLGLSYEELEKINPQLVMTSISNFGQSGPYRDFKASELIIYGMGGAMNETGMFDRYPLKKAGNVVQHQVGTMSAVATMVALFASQAQGAGQHIDMSMFESQMGTIDRRMSQLITYQYNNETSYRPDPALEPPGFPMGIYACQDGFFQLSGGFVFWPRICKMMDRLDLLDDPGFSTQEGQREPENLERFSIIWYPWIAEHTKLEIITAGQAAGVLCGPINTPGDLVNDPHWKARGFWEEIEHPVTGRLTYPGAPFKMEETPWRASRPAPRLGEHNTKVYGELGYSGEDLVRLVQQGVI